MLPKAVVVGLVVLTAAVTGSVASSIGNEADDSHQLGSVSVTAGDSALTTVDSDSPAIDFTATGAAGVTPGMRLTIGDTAAPADDHAFALTNTGKDPVQVTVGYEYAHTPPQNAGVTLAILDSRGTKFTDTSGPHMSLELEPDTSAYVIVTIDATDATINTALSGTLTISVHEIPDS